MNTLFHTLKTLTNSCNKVLFLSKKWIELKNLSKLHVKKQFDEKSYAPSDLAGRILSLRKKFFWSKKGTTTSEISMTCILFFIKICLDKEYVSKYVLPICINLKLF